MDGTVKIYASEGGHDPKTWGRIVANRILMIDADAPADKIQLFADEKNRVGAVVAALVPKIKEDALEKNTIEDWARIVTEKIEETSPDSLKDSYTEQHERIAFHVSSYIRTMIEELK